METVARGAHHAVELTAEEHHALWLARHPPPLLEPYDPWESPIPEGRTLITCGCGALFTIDNADRERIDEALIEVDHGEACPK